MTSHNAPLRFFYHPQSRARMVRWMLEECGAVYEPVRLEFGGTMKSPDYLALNPMGKVPALRHGEVVVTETAAICAYLAEQFPAKHLAPPANSPERGTYYRWLFFAAGPMEAAVTAKAMGLLAPAERRASAGYGSFEDVMATVEFAVGQALARGGTLCGQFTAADLCLAAHLNFGMQLKTIEPRPLFEQYVRPLVQRAACVRANALDDALVPPATGQG